MIKWRFFALLRKKIFSYARGMCLLHKKNSISNLLTLLAMVLGAGLGFLDLSFVNGASETTSQLFLRLLQLVSLPLIFLAIASTISGMRDFQEMQKMGRKVVTYTLVTTVLAAAVALALYLFLDPAHAVVTGADGMKEQLTPQASYLSFLKNIIPANLVHAFVESNVMGIAFVAILFSVAILLLPSHQKKTLNDLFSSLMAMMLKVTGMILTLMPLAVFAFAVILVRDLRNNYQHMSSLMLYLLCVVGANLIQGLIILPLMLKWKKVPVWKSLKGMMPALTLAFFSKSSNATLPVTMRSLEKNLGVSEKVSSFTLPLCSVINMNGCAAFILTTVLYVSTVEGVTFTAFDFIGWIFLATLAAVGNAGVPMGCFFLTSAFLMGMNLPLTMMGLILPFYTLIDMIETTLNVWSDACVALAVEKDIGQEIPEKLPELSQTN